MKKLNNSKTEKGKKDTKTTKKDSKSKAKAVTLKELPAKAGNSLGEVERTQGPGKRLTIKEREKVLDMASQGIQVHDIAREVGISKPTIYRIVEKAQQESGSIAAFVKARPDILAQTQQMMAELQHKIIASITDQDVSGATFAQRTEAAAKLNTAIAVSIDKERLERGQSTSNVQNLLVIAKKRALEDFKRGCAGGRLPVGELQKIHNEVPDLGTESGKQTSDSINVD